jgi:hypothetical protein
MQWLRHISLRKQEESKSDLSAALKQVTDVGNVFDELRKTLQDITADVREKAAQAPEKKKGGIKTPLATPAMKAQGADAAPSRTSFHEHPAERPKDSAERPKDSAERSKDSAERSKDPRVDDE